MRLAGARTLEDANAYLEKEYLPLWNERFTVVPASAQNAHRPLRAAHDLAAILSHVEERVVSSDYTLRYQGKVYQIARQEARPGLRAGRVRVEQRLDGSLAVRFRQHYLAVAECEPQPRRALLLKTVSSPRPRPVPPGRWMQGFNLQKGPPLWAILKGEMSPQPDTG